MVTDTEKDFKHCYLDIINVTLFKRFFNDPDLITMYAAKIFRLIYTFDIYYCFCFLLSKVICRLYRHCLTDKVHHLPRVVKEYMYMYINITNVSCSSGNGLRFYSFRTTSTMNQNSKDSNLN